MRRNASRFLRPDRRFGGRVSQARHVSLVRTIALGLRYQVGVDYPSTDWASSITRTASRWLWYPTGSMGLAYTPFNHCYTVWTSIGRIRWVGWVCRVRLPVVRFRVNPWLPIGPGRMCSCHRRCRHPIIPSIAILIPGLRQLFSADMDVPSTCDECGSDVVKSTDPCLLRDNVIVECTACSWQTQIVF